MMLTRAAGTLSRAFHRIPGGFLAAKFLKKLAQPRNPEGFTTYRFRGMTFRVELGTHLGAKLFWRGAHSWPPIFVLQQWIKPGHTCVDLGANQGEYSLWMSSLSGPTGEVHSFEPSSKMLEQLRTARELNLPRAQNVIIHPYGLSDVDAQVELFLPSAVHQAGNEGAATVFRTSDTDQSLGRIELKNAGQALSAATSRRINFIKMDIEGSEMKALRGMRGRLEADRPVLLVEVNRHALNLAGSSPKELANFLIDLNYRLALVGPRGRLVPYEAEEADAYEDVNICALPAVSPAH